MEALSKVNHKAAWAVIVLLHILGFLWYGPIFGEPWMKMVGLNPATVEANPPSAGIWITNLIATVVPVYLLAILFQKMNISTLKTGAIWGFLIAFGFLHLTGMTSNMFADRPYALSWITGGYNMVALTLAGAILGAWKK